MSDILGRMARFVTQLPGRIVRAVPWAHMEPAGLGAGTVHTQDLDEIEQERRQDREVLRRDDDWRPNP
jgi:hypothetical protein